MIHPDDVAAWIAQVRQEPEAAPYIIKALAERLIELDERNEALRDELLDLRRTGEASTDAGAVTALTRRVQALERQLARGAAAGPEGTVRSLLALTLDGRGARLPLPDAANWQKQADRQLTAQHLRPRHLLVAGDEAQLLLFTDKGRALRLEAAGIEFVEAPASYLSLLPGLALDLDESIGVVVPIPASFEQMTLLTRKGFARSFRRAEVDSLLERGLPLHSSPIEGDYPALVLFGSGKGELLVVTRGGKGVRFPERAVGVQAQPAIKLDRGDVVVGAAPVDDETTIMVAGAEGDGARREMAGFGAHPTAGHPGKIFTRIEGLVGAVAANQEHTLWLLTAAGQLLAVPAAQVPAGPGASRGKRIVKLGQDRLVALVV